MTIDISTERLLTISAAAKTLPGRPHVATVWRWIYHGVRGVKLATVLVGGRRFTSREAIERFIEATTAAAAGEPVPTRSAKQRERAIQQAERELAAMGV